MSFLLLKSVRAQWILFTFGTQTSRQYTQNKDIVRDMYKRRKEYKNGPLKGCMTCLFMTSTRGRFCRLCAQSQDRENHLMFISNPVFSNAKKRKLAATVDYFMNLLDEIDTATSVLPKCIDSSKLVFFLKKLRYLYQNIS